ncbi:MULTISPECIES: helix-turn-helix domain-containing protein [Bradyrhizobium]|uniref:helix-turn-helix domain-containing protein n=1 Tax=Bradyrhizobium elkanii TaxID=29448 RepID=UPI00048A3C63
MFFARGLDRLLTDLPVESSCRTQARKISLHAKRSRLSRRREGATYQQLLDEIRYTMARELLGLTELSVGEVAEALSYSEQSDKGFRRWSGISPNEWRVAARSGSEAIDEPATGQFQKRAIDSRSARKHRGTVA